jgi:hypothetical protein
MKNLLNKKLFESFDKKFRNYSLFDKLLFEPITTLG